MHEDPRVLNSYVVYLIHFEEVISKGISSFKRKLEMIDMITYCNISADRPYGASRLIHGYCNISVMLSEIIVLYTG